MTAPAKRFLELHHGDGPLLMPNAWDRGSALLLASLGFDALATTSSGYAATLGRLDGAVTREEALAHAADLVAVAGVPVSADLENGFASDATGVGETVRLARATGLAGCSIEDSTGRGEDPIFSIAEAVERLTAAVEAAAGEVVITGRAENFLHGRPDLDDTIARLQAYEAAGADVLYAPGLAAIGDIRDVVAAVGRPVNVLTWPGAPTVRELAEAGVARISVGGAFAFAALGAVVEAARELAGPGTTEFLRLAGAGSKAAKAAFTDRPRGV